MENLDQKKDNIDKIKEALYSKNTDGIFVKRRHDLEDKSNIKIPSAWNSEDIQSESNFQIPYNKILLGAFVFFVLALGFTFSKFFLGNNVVSGNNIDILLSGPVSIAGGEELPLEIEVRNNNNIDLKVVDLRIEYPDGTKSPTDQSVDMKRYSEVLGDISVGKSEKRLIKSVIYGEENSLKVVKIVVEYRISGSSAIFSKQKEFSVLISSSPVNIKVNAPTNINANQLTDFSIDINSNSTNVIKNLILKLDYPFGFNLSSSNPKASDSLNSVFEIGDLEPGAKRNVRISGIVLGQDGEERVFKFTVGTPSKDDDNVIGTPLALYVSTVLLKKSSVGLDISVNNQSQAEIAIDTLSKNRVSMFWKNNLTEKIFDMEVRVKFLGQAVDKGSVKSEKGFYNSLDNSIVFNEDSDAQLASVSPGDEGDMRFEFNIIPPTQKTFSMFGNSSATLDITVLGNRAGSSGSGNKEVLYSDTKTLKISSNLKLLSRGFRTVGPFENSGPFPPQVDNETTYTITWTATNSFNNINSAKVVAFLPPNVVWTGFTSPDSEKITYDKGTGEIVWNIGDMRPGIGTNYPVKEVSFQVAITPSITQVGSEINLLNESTISGIDSYSNARLGEVKSPITTNITSDPEYVNDIGKVVK